MNWRCGSCASCVGSTRDLCTVSDFECDDDDDAVGVGARRLAISGSMRGNTDGGRSSGESSGSTGTGMRDWRYNMMPK